MSYSPTVSGANYHIGSIFNYTGNPAMEVTRIATTEDPITQVAIKAICLDFLDPTKLSAIEIQNLSKKKLLAQAKIKDGRFVHLYLHENWVVKINNEKITDFIYENYGVPFIIDQNVPYAPISIESYDELSNQLIMDSMKDKSSNELKVNREKECNIQ